MTYSDGMSIQQCPYCGEMYTTQDACPSCASKDVPKTKQTGVNSRLSVVSSMLTFSKYKKLSKGSKEEYNRYLYLRGLAQDGIIQDLQLQVSYPLLDAVKVPSVNWYNKSGYKQGAVSYSPDFVYSYQGKQVIEEYKGVTKLKSGTLKPRITPASRLRVKMWLAKYSDKIISGTWFFVISGWHRQASQYVAFDSNGNQISYPVTNYEYMQTESEAA